MQKFRMFLAKGDCRYRLKIIAISPSMVLMGPFQLEIFFVSISLLPSKVGAFFFLPSTFFLRKNVPLSDTSDEVWHKDV